MDPNARAVIFHARPGDEYRCGRTLRSLETAGFPRESIVQIRHGEIPGDLLDGRPLLLLRAGAWLTSRGPLRPPPSSATGRGLCALGCLRSPGKTGAETREAEQQWRELFLATGGEFSRLSEGHPDLPVPVSLYLDALAMKHFAGHALPNSAWIWQYAAHHLRCVHDPLLDVHDDTGLRIIQVIPVLHRGGAERVALNLHSALPGCGVRCQLATLSHSSRQTFAAPSGHLDLSRIPGRRDERFAALFRSAVRFGTDLFHAHLLSAADLRRLSDAGFPVLVTLHNTSEGWPEGARSMQSGDTALIVACSQTVESEARQFQIPIPLRTVWNGIDLDEFRLTPEHLQAGRELRRRWNVRDNDWILLTLANPRPQKRLHLLPAILSCVQSILSPKMPGRIRWISAGESVAGDQEAAKYSALIQSEIHRLGLANSVHSAGSVGDIPALLAAADIVICPSAHEGLSLAQLEALAMQRPVIATAVGGTAEVARFHTGFHLMSPEASPEEFARVVASLALGCKDPPSPRPTELILRQESVEAPRPLKIFSRQRMAARYHWFYRRAIAASQRLTSATGVWLVTNNFSTGGAQSSARRLLEGLAGRGIKVRAAVVQENPEDPTPGHQRLAAAGIRILALPPVGQMNPRHAVETLLEAIDRDPPAVVFYWNLIPEYKVLLTDALLRTPVFDISPGEMFYASLERYFQGPNRWESYWTARDYGARLEGVVVKYAAEATRALQCLGARVHIIPNGIPLSPPESRYFITTRIQPDPNRPFLLGTVARIHPHKRLEDLLLALKMAQPDLPSWRLQIAGGIDPGCEDYGRQLKNMAMDMPVDWLGEQSELASHHRNWDLFVLIAEPAGCPNASLEAMAAGLPVLATDAGGMAEQVVDGVTGRLTPARQPALLARALIEVIEHPSRLATMARAARKHIEARFSLDRMVKDYLELIVG